MAQTARPVLERLMESISKDSTTGCWVWQKSGQNGYGQIWIGSRSDGSRRRRLAYAVAYEVLKGPVPEGLCLDHLCRNPACINPDHLEPVTLGENVLRGMAPSAVNARKTHCKRGHEFTPLNTYSNRGKRYCRACRPRRAT